MLGLRADAGKDVGPARGADRAAGVLIDHQLVERAGGARLQVRGGAALGDACLHQHGAAAWEDGLIRRERAHRGHLHAE